MGDRDRHRDQFRWASFSDSTPTFWQPISRDHDEAFVKIDGPVLDIAAIDYPPLVNFTEDYPPHLRLNWHSREIDRRFLVGLDRHAWDSVATALQATLTDAVIDDAVRKLPPEMYAVAGARLARILRVRRDKLVDEALSYYRFLAGEVEIHATDAAEVATITRVDEHALDLSIRERRASAPWFQRRFDDRETREIRLRLWGRDDSVLVSGPGSANIRVRVVGGKGDDVLVDSARTGYLRYYDDAGDNRVVSGNGLRINSKPYQEWVGNDTVRYPPREWGTWWRPLPWITASSDLGLFIGGGFVRTEYGFRRAPWASNIDARVGYATSAAAPRAELNADVRRENASLFWRLNLYASGIEVLRYYGPGNASDSTGGVEFHKVDQQQYAVRPSLALPLGKSAELSVGPMLRWSHTGANEGRFIAGIRDTLYGAGDFGEVGARAGFSLDTRDKAANPRSGVHLRTEARVVPAVWDATSSYGSLEGEAATYLSASLPTTPVLALRAGASKLWGTFPFEDAAFLGGRATLRGFPQQRFAGDAATWGSAELRLSLTRTYIFLPALWGLFGGGDAGRVWVNGDSPGGWHTDAGGGIWIAFLDRANTLTFGFSLSPERTAIYAGMGFAF